MAAVIDKITPHHLNGRAYVYIRQSSAKQVLRNQESQSNQRALVDRAMALGWRPERIEVIDADQGQSGQDGERVGFQGLVAAVSLGQVGCIFAYEASRLARNNCDWYTLLDLATVVGTLIADADGIYDPRSYNDRLLLGLRGMLSEAELHLLRLRLDAGRMRQVERGTYRQHLPTGLVRLPDGRVVKDPDEQIQRTITLVFTRFAALGSAQKVLRSLHGDGIPLPRFQTSGLHAGQLVWKKPTSSTIQEILHNPAYAGAFVYGRHGPHPDRRPGQTRQIKRAPEEWTAGHHDVYPAFIRWEEFVANQERLTDNANRFAERTRGAPREGAALLVGLVVCGRCGRQMRVTYKPQIRYFCNALSGTFAEPMCLHLDGTSIDAAVVDAFFSAIQPAELDLLDDVLATAYADHARLVQHYADQVKRAEYEARLAQRQYDAIVGTGQTGHVLAAIELVPPALQKRRKRLNRLLQPRGEMRAPRVHLRPIACDPLPQRGSGRQIPGDRSGRRLPVAGHRPEPPVRLAKSRRTRVPALECLRDQRPSPTEATIPFFSRQRSSVAPRAVRSSSIPKPANSRGRTPAVRPTGRTARIVSWTTARSGAAASSGWTGCSTSRTPPRSWRTATAR
jgi:DNA invertase Pin-like site-specific DNA recombinase